MTPRYFPQTTRLAFVRKCGAVFSGRCRLAPLWAVGLILLVSCGSEGVSAADEGPAVSSKQNPDQHLQTRPVVRWSNRQGVRLSAARIEASPSVVLENCKDVVIEGCDLRGVRLVNCTGVIITGNTIRDAGMPGVELDECSEVQIRGNRFARVASGVYAHRSRGVRVVGNVAEDVTGPIPRGQLAQFDKVTGPGNEIAWNLALNRRGQSEPEDLINVYMSQGTPDDPIDVHHNVLLGDPAHGSAGKSDSGSGIMLGDGGGRFQVARHNVVINPGQVGIGVAGGGDIAVVDNLVRGERSDVSNVGVYCWNQYDAPTGPVTIVGNRIDWTHAEGHANHLWLGGGFPEVIAEDNIQGDPSLRDWRPLLRAMRQKLAAGR